MRSGSGRGNGPAAAEPKFAELLDREAMERPTPPGRAVDLGCGTGTHAIDLASRGWRAAGIDNQRRALQIARARAAASGTDVTFVQGDVAALRVDDIGAPADLFLDVGCFHHLPGPARQAMADCVAAAAAPDATLLLLAFSPGRVGLWHPGPAGRRSRQPSVAGRSSPTSQPTPQACPARSKAPHRGGTGSGSASRSHHDQRQRSLRSAHAGRCVFRSAAKTG